MSTTNQNGMRVNPTMNILQLIFEIAIIVGYAIGIISGFIFLFLYWFAMFWVIPMAIANLIFAFQQKNGTEAFTITNLIMSVITIIPFIGFFSAVAGIVMSSLSLAKVGKYMGQEQNQPGPSIGQNSQPEKVTDVEEVTKAETKALEAESKDERVEDSVADQNDEAAKAMTDEYEKEEVEEKIKKYAEIFQQETYTKVRVGDLYVPTGEIVCRDPFLPGVVVSDKIPTGKFPGEILLLKTENSGVRVAYAQLVFSKDEPTTYEKVGIFGVDAGMASFMDKETQTLFDKKMDELVEADSSKNYYDEVLSDEMAKNGGLHGSSKYGDWVNHFPDSSLENNVVIFSSGFGDGGYPVYLGKDSKGEPVALYIDFRVED